MAIFKFRDFVFDSDRYRLERNGVRVALRPKVLELLCLLIENRHRVVSKTEILTLIWSQAYARDHLLFQLISELRKAPFEASFVRTKPNEGYCWNVPTEIVPNEIVPNEIVPNEIKKANWWAKSPQIAAMLALTVICGATFYLTSEQNRSAVRVAQLPAHSAFTKGIIAMESGQNVQAEEWFRFTLTENPESAEASLFLAEVLLQQNRPEESSAQLYSLLALPNLGAYNTVTATDLLSRINQRQGRLKTALKYAYQSSEANVLAQCSITVVDERVQMLEGQIGLPSSPAQAAHRASPSDELIVAPAPKQHKDHYQNQCEQLKQGSQETSYCSPESSYEGYVYRQTTAGHKFA
jgi:DNA-binding winged helix-turn-helix (wHTH) protein